MQKHLDPEERLDILRRADGIRKWNSLDDKRICVICERVFTGRQIEIHRDQRRALRAGVSNGRMPFVRGALVLCRQRRTRRGQSFARWK